MESSRSGGPQPPRRRRVTATDVARAAGVSQATVSYVLNDTPGQTIPERTRERVREAMARLGYTPHAAARTLRTGRSDVVLLVVPDWPLGPSLDALFERLSDGLEDRGLSLLVRRVRASRPLAATWRTVSPTAVVTLEGLDAAEVRAMEDSGVPVVAAVVRDRRSGAGMLAASHVRLGALQLQHLAATGHVRTGYADPHDPRVAVFRDLRLDGARTAAVDLGLPDPVVRVVPPDVAAAADAARAWRAEGVTAVCAYNDEVAFALLAGLRAAGLAAPGDLAVIGVDDIPLAPFASPPLTTVSADVEALADYLAAAVVRRIEGEDPPAAPRSEAVRLVVRGSA